MTLLELRMKGLLGFAIEKSGSSIGLILFFLCYLLAIVAGYLLGSINCSLLISRFGYKDDVRKHGSGNAGMTNVMRTYGKKAAALTLLGDALKGALAVVFGMLCCGINTAYLAALFCTVGHAYPIFFGFKGGKGVVVTAVTVLCLNPLLFLILFVMFVALVAMTKYISVGSIMCMLMYPLFLSSLEGGSFHVLVAIANAAFVIFLHRSNITRLREGTENKFSFKKSVPKPTSASKTADDASPEAEESSVLAPSSDEMREKKPKNKKK